MADIKQLPVRMPADLHDALKGAAYVTDRSMNDIAVEAIRRYLSGDVVRTMTREAATDKAERRYRSVLDKLKDL